MLVLVKLVDVDAEEGVWQEAWQRRVGKIEVDYQCYEKGKWRAPTPFPTPLVSIAWPDDAVAVCIPIVNMLLYNSLVLVCSRPIIFCGAIGLFAGCSNRSS